MTESYERRREDQARRREESSRQARDIGPIQPIANVRRRAKCRKSLQLFCETYNSEALYLGWSADHLKVIARIEEAALQGALFAFAMPRGSGKTTLCRMAALWAVSYALCRYVFVIGANASKAEDTLDAIKTWVRFLPTYTADFPEIAGPAQALDGIAQRGGGQLCEGRPTMIEWGQSRIVLPTVPVPPNWPKSWKRRDDGQAPSSGAILGASGLTGDGIRGSLLTLTTGELVRPDLVLLDDPQTDESARSVSQNIDREQLIAGAVLGMAGPGRTLSAVMPCTVIAKDDMIDRILDRKKHPLWRGERTKLLRTMPANMDAWERHLDVYRECAQKEPPNYAAAVADYQAHRAELEEGAEASWPDRKLPWEVSAIQHAMYLWCRNPRAFASEYQNEPEDEELSAEDQLTPDGLLARLNRLPRGTVPAAAAHLVAMIDVQASLLWYVVAGFSDRFGGAIVDYGAWPRQRRAYYTLRDASPTLADVFPGQGPEALIRSGLDALTAELLGKEWASETGAILRVEKCLVDAAFQGDVVKQFCRQSPHAAVLLPRYGKGITAGQSPLTARKKQEWERFGLNWIVGQKAANRYVMVDTNFWKSFTRARLQVAVGDPSALVLFGERPEAHRMLADQLAAEKSTRIKPEQDKNLREVDIWKNPPGRDNHLFDCLVGCAVAASIQGCNLGELPSTRPAGPKRRVKYSEIDRQKREQEATGRR